MTNQMKLVAVLVILGCCFMATPALAQNNSCMSLSMLVQGKLDPTQGGWVGTVKGLLVDKNKKVTPLEGALVYIFKEGTPPVYTGQVAHESGHPAFDFGPIAGKFAALLDKEIAQYAPQVTPHFEFDPQAPPMFVLGRTMASFKVAPITTTAWSSSGWFAKATGNITMSGTFLVNSQNFPVIGYWNVEINGNLCNVEIQ